MQDDNKSSHKVISLLSFCENELYEEYSPILDDLRVTHLKRTVSKDYESYLLPEPETFDDVRAKNSYYNLLYNLLVEGISPLDETLKIDSIGHGNPVRDAEIMRAIHDALAQHFEMGKVLQTPVRLKHITIELYGCQIQDDFRHSDFWKEVKKIAKFNIPLVIAFGGVNHNLSSAEFSYSQNGFSDDKSRILKRLCEFNFDIKLAKYSFVTFNGARLVSLKADFSCLDDWKHRKMNPTFVMLCPHTSAGVWTNGHDTWNNAAYTGIGYQYGITPPKISFCSRFATNTFGTPTECYDLKVNDFQPKHVPEFVKNY